MITYLQFSKSVHVVEGARDCPFAFSEWLKLLKTRFGNVKEAKHNMPNPFKICPELEDAISEIWEEIQPYDFLTALQIENVNKKRIVFQAIGPNTILGREGVIKKLIDKYEHSDKLGDKYELFDIDTKSLGIESLVRNMTALRYQCPSTGKTYWSYVPMEIRQAKEAVAWMCTTSYKEEDIEAIYRQGEVYMIKVKDNAKKMSETRHMKKDEYWSKIADQT
jgi:hypothetical protein